MSVTESSRARGVDRVVSILKQLHSVRRPMTMRELIEATGAPRSSIYELVTILTEAGWLEAGADGSVFFGREIGMSELMHQGQAIVDRIGKPVEIYGLVAVLYFIVCFPLSRWVRRHDRRRSLLS